MSEINGTGGIVTALVPRRLWTEQFDGRARNCRGAILFADIAGFTRLTETAKRRGGTRGIEELTGRINAIFGDLVSSALMTGGDILKFGGDAILVAFDANGNDRDSIRRAIQCAALMRKAMTRHRRTTLSSLSLHLGIAQGDWREYVAGIPGTRREHFVWGSAISDAMHCADSTKKAARIKCPTPLLPASIDLKIERVGRQLFDFLPSLDVRLGESKSAGVTDSDSGQLWDFVPEAIRTQERIGAFDPARSAEHRRVATVFGFWKCPQAMRNAELSARLINEIFCCTFEANQTHGGLWARSDPSGDKQKLLLLFGATQSAPDDVDRALAFAESLSAEFAKLAKGFPSLRIGIGVATATVLTGFVGNIDRREFTAMGDGVNLAARLAAKAPKGTTLADLATTNESTKHRFRPAGTLALKNVRKPAPVFKPAGIIDASVTLDGDAIIEHPQAMRSCMKVWEDGARTCWLNVQDGVDTPKFIRQLYERVGERPERPIIVTFDPTDASHPLAGLRRLITAIGSSQEAFGKLTVHEELQALLHGDDSRIARIISRLGIESAAREIATHAQQLPSVGQLYQLEHIERLSALDRLIFERLVEFNQARWLILEQGQPGQSSVTAHARSINLGPIGREELGQVIADVVHPARASRTLIDFLHERSKGTVRLARSLLAHLISHGAVHRSAGIRPVWQLRSTENVDIPNGLRALYLQQVDRLPASDQLALRAISVLGDSAPRDALEILCKEIGAEELAMCLDRLQASGLVEVRTDESGSRVSHRDATCRQAVYDTMSHQLRESWHHTAAEYWRNLSTNDPARLGEHLFRARDVKSAKWLERASHQAQRVWSLDRARHYSRWAILATQGVCNVDYAPICPPFTVKPAPKEKDLFSGLASILQLQGLHSQAGRIHRWLSRVGEREKDLRSSCRHLLLSARMDWYGGRYEKSGRQAQSVLNRARRLRDKTLTAQAAYLVGETCRRTGRVKASLAALTEAESLLRNSRDYDLLADVLNALGLLHWNCGRLTDARSCFERSLRTLGRSKDAARQGQVANNLGILLEEQGLLPRAQRYYEKAFALFDRSGVRRHRAYSLGNLANLYRHGARYERARSAYEEVDTELRSMGEAHAAAYTLGNLGDLARDFGDAETASDHYDSTLQFAVKSGDEELKAECYARQAQLDLLMMRADLAEPQIRKAREAAKRAGSREFSLYAQLLTVECDIFRRDTVKARKRLALASSDAATVGLVYYQMWVAHAQARLEQMDGSLQKADQLLRSGMTKARQCGYRWWELRFAALGIDEHMPPTVREECARPCASLIRDIRSGIGDEVMLTRFNNSAIVSQMRALLGATQFDSSDWS